MQGIRVDLSIKASKSSKDILKFLSKEYESKIELKKSKNLEVDISYPRNTSRFKYKSE